MNAPSTVLVTGATGKTGRRLAKLLENNGQLARLATRSSHEESDRFVRFDWTDRSSHVEALRNVSAIYLVAPSNVAEPLQTMLPFLERALDHGIKRYVLLSAVSIDEGGPLMGAVHAWLKAGVPEWAVLRPSWFMQNFSEQQHGGTIRDESRIYSATGDGKLPFIDAHDIAAVAASALVSPASPNREFILTGGRAISFDEVATIIGHACGRSIEHIRLSEEQLVVRYRRTGLSQPYAEALAAMDIDIANGAYEAVTRDVEAVTHRAPIAFESYAASAASAWVKS